MKKKKLKLLVTGGSGFMGRNFIETYKDRYDITAPSHAEMSLTDPSSISKMFKSNAFDAVLHLAGVEEGPENLVMFKNIQYLSVVYGVKKLLIAGEGVEFDRTRAIESISESQFGQSIPTDAYGLNRYLIQILAQKDKISTTLRFFTVYGKHQNPAHSAIMDIIGKGALGQKCIQIPKDKTFSTIYIEDAVKIIAAFLDNDFPKGDYNIAATQKVSLLQTAKIVKRLAKEGGTDIVIKTLSDTPALEYSASNGKLLKLMPNLRFTSYQSGIKKVYERLKVYKYEARPRHF